MERDPLEGMLLRLSSAQATANAITDMHGRGRTFLTRLENALEYPPPPPKKIDYYKRDLWDGMYPLFSFDEADLPKAQEIYRRIVIAGGNGSSHMQKTLLELIALGCQPRSVPFWLELMYLKRPRDQWAGERRTFALAALALLVYMRQDHSALDALRAACHHDDHEVRSLAVYYLGQTYLASEEELPLPLEVAAEVRSIATGDPTFEPRFQARSLLRAAGMPVPLDEPAGVFTFKVKFMWDKRIFRTIDVRSKQTLMHLHTAIQRAIDWDDDHLYSFYMRGKLYDHLYEIPCPEMAMGEMHSMKLFFGPEDARDLLVDARMLMGEVQQSTESPNEGLDAGASYQNKSEEEEGTEDVRLYADEAVIGELGLVAKHKFLYFFDFGDSHEFEVEVVGTKLKAEPGRYPRVVESQGDAPPQYETWDDDWESDSQGPD